MLMAMGRVGSAAVRGHQHRVGGAGERFHVHLGAQPGAGGGVEIVLTQTHGKAGQGLGAGALAGEEQAVSAVHAIQDRGGPEGVFVGGGAGGFAGREDDVIEIGKSQRRAEHGIGARLQLREIHAGADHVALRGGMPRCT